MDMSLDVCTTENGYLWCFVEHCTYNAIGQSLAVFSDVWFVYRFWVEVCNCVVCGSTGGRNFSYALSSNVVLVVREGGGQGAQAFNQFLFQGFQ